MSERLSEVDRFLALVAAAQEGDIRLTSIQAGLLVAAELGIARDSRAFARKLGIAHSLVLRELNVLAERQDLLEIVRREPRTMTVHYTLPPASSAQATALLLVALSRNRCTLMTRYHRQTRFLVSEGYSP